MIRESEVILFGGRIGREGGGALSNQLYLLSLNDLVSPVRLQIKLMLFFLMMLNDMY